MENGEREMRAAGEDRVKDVLSHFQALTHGHLVSLSRIGRRTSWQTALPVGLRKSA